MLPSGLQPSVPWRPANFPNSEVSLSGREHSDAGRVLGGTGSKGDSDCECAGTERAPNHAGEETSHASKNRGLSEMD